MGYSQRLVYETIRTFNAASLSGSYQAIGGPLLHNASLIKMVNISNSNVLVSIDGVNQHDICPAGGFWLYDETANAIPGKSEGIFDPQGTQYFVQGSVGVGTIYLVVKYIQII